MSEPDLPLPDFPLIVEGLLIEARQVADSGAAPEMIAEILDQVAVLREGRD